MRHRIVTAFGDNSEASWQPIPAAQRQVVILLIRAVRDAHRTRRALLCSALLSVIVDEPKKRLGDGVRCGWAAGDADVDRKDILDRAELVHVANEVAAECAVAEGGDAAWLGHGVVGDKERLAHARRDGACDEEHVGVAGGSDNAEPVALQVVVGARGERELVLAAVAGAGVDMAEGEASSAIGGGEVELAAESAEVAEKGQHQRSTQA
jgi:hypothetical protein